MGPPVPLTSCSEFLRTPSVLPWYADRYLRHIPTCAPLESAVPLIKHQPREPSLPTIIYLISAGATGMMM